MFYLVLFMGWSTEGVASASSFHICGTGLSEHNQGLRTGSIQNTSISVFQSCGSSTLHGVCCHVIKRHLLPGRKAITNLDTILKSRDITLLTKVCHQSYGFSSSHVWMWELDCEESWALKKWCFWTVVLKTLESPLDCKEIQPAHSEGDQPRITLEGMMLKLKL